MRKVLLLAFIAACSPAWAGQTRTQHVVKTACGTSCAVTITANGTGSTKLLVMQGWSNASGGTVTAVSGGGTWTHPAGCAATSTTAGGATDFWYLIAPTSSVTTVTVTFSAANSTLNEAEVAEYTTTASPWTFGACAILSNQGATTSPTSPSLSPTGTGSANLLVSGLFVQGAISAGSTVTGTGWTTPIVDAPGGDGFDDGLAAASGATQATMTATSGAYCSSGIWFSDAVGAGGAAAGFNKRKKLLKLDL